jgi:uncharacterized protein (TIGR00251 family)
MPEGTIVKLRVSPRARRSEARGLYGEGGIQPSIAAPPVDGKANAEVERFLADLLGVARGRVSLVGGASSRDKTVLAEGGEPADVREALLPKAAPGRVG